MEGIPMAVACERDKTKLYRDRVEAIRAAGSYIAEHAEDFLGEPGEAIEDGSLRLEVEIDPRHFICPSVVARRRVFVIPKPWA